MHRYIKILKTFLSIWKEFLTESSHIDPLTDIAIILLVIIDILLAIVLVGFRIFIIAFGIMFIATIVFLTILFMFEAVEIVKIEERSLKYIKKEKKTTYQ